MSNIVNELQSAVMNNQDVTAIDGPDPLSFSRLWSLTDRFAGGLRSHGLDTGDRVGICLTEPTELLVAVYGTLRNGCVPVVFSPELFDSDVAAGLDEVGAPALVVDDRSPVTLISLSEAMRFIITVDMDTYFGLTYEEFLDNSGINSSGSRTGLELIERSDDETALVAYGERADELIDRRYTHGEVRDAATELVTDGVVDRHLGCLPPSHPMALMYEATATLIDGGCYVPVGDWNPVTAYARFVDGAADRAYVTPSQCADLREQGLDPSRRPIAVLHPVFASDRDDRDPQSIEGVPEIERATT